MRTVYNMDKAWLFLRGEGDEVIHKTHSDSYQAVKAGNMGGCAARQCDVSNWRELDLPHDYLSESSFSPEYLHSHGYRERCNAWYRKSFTLDKSLEGKQLYLCFEGTAVNAEFYFNGSLMARSFSAYTETVFDITERAYTDGRPNVLAVHINGLTFEGWWYEGAGIYRHVKLFAKEKLHIAHNGIFAKPVLKKNTKNSWLIDLETELENSDYTKRNACVNVKVYDHGTLVAENTSKNTDVDFTSKAVVKQQLSVGKVHRWDIDDPYLYDVVFTVIENGEETDSDSCRIGFRTIRVDAETGFWLNEKNIKIKGTCNHQDHAGVGVAIPDTLQYYRIKRLKEMGTNGYRCSHNLPAKEVLDACDELGLIVMDENRRFETRTEVLDYVETMVKRDRNHPSVVFWSLFNEEPLQNSEEGAKIFKRMRSVVEHLDDSRFITGAINGNMDGAGLEMDITGINYCIPKVEEHRSKYPTQPVIGSENNSAVTTRGCYRSDRENAQVLANYDEETVPWGQTICQTWDFVRKHDWFAGIFIWTGFDYRGEPTPFTWPSVSSQFGIMDTCGFAKDSFYFNKACFTDRPMVHLMPHWNWKKGDTVRVMAVTNCEEAELFLNGKSLGKKKADVCKQPEWMVEYEKGRIEVKAYNNGKCVAKDICRTASKPYAVVMEPAAEEVSDDGQDVMILNIHVVDKQGHIVETADNMIHFDIQGDAMLLGVGNGDPNSHESDVEPMRRLFCGRCQAIVRANQNAEHITVVASSEELVSASFSPAILHVPEVNYMPSCVNYDIAGFTLSPVYDKRPDPSRVFTDDDMNSFSPFAFSQNYPGEYYKGYRMYRVVTKANFKSGKMALELGEIRVHGLEIYINGKEIYNRYTGSNELLALEDKFVFYAMQGETLDIRLLCYKEDDGDIGGIRKYVRIKDNV